MGCVSTILIGEGSSSDPAEYRRHPADALFIQFLLNTLRHESVTLPSSLNASNIQVLNLAAVMVTADMPPFARVGARIDSLVSAKGDARSLQGGTLIKPAARADGRVYALAKGPLTIEAIPPERRVARPTQEFPNRGADSRRRDG